MKFACLILILALTFNSSAQSVGLKKKYLKTYVGKIPAYEVNLNNEIIAINPIEIEINLTKDSLFVRIGSVQWQGTYSTSKLERKKFEITGKMSGTGIPEIFLLDAKKRTIMRKGLFPQPNAVLDRIK
jgi:hypothetical protein